MQLHHNLYVPPSNFWQVIPPSEPPKYAQTIHIMWQNYDRKFNQENFCGLEFSQDGSLYICKLSHLIYLSSRLWRFHGTFFFRRTIWKRWWMLKGHLLFDSLALQQLCHQSSRISEVFHSLFWPYKVSLWIFQCSKLKRIHKRHTHSFI